jgi:ribosomal protein L11 methyltransferase
VGVSETESAEVAALLQAQAPGGTVIEETREGTVVKAYFPLDTGPEPGAGALSALAHHFPHLRPLDRPLLEEEWMQGWRSFFPPLPVGEKLLILPPWERRRPPHGRVTVVIDPGPAFGTGHHPTTQMCLEAVECSLKPGMRVLDMGTGSGILAIAAARLGAKKVVALDTDWVATKAARGNARANRVLGRVSVRTSSLNGRLKPFDLLLANISSRTIIELARPLARAARPGAVLAASGFLAESLSAVERALGEAGWRPINVLTGDEWRTLVVSRT